ncbi:glycosyltransferase [Streptomyces sp. NPDC050610]|uniref:glycosyltransferase n=1 Tax=Streptomyces sp. NPDC050610 TaxID=3157097 RepID=UPI003412CC87
MKIAFLLHNAYGIGGTNRTTFNLAAALADRHQVEIASMTRHRDEPGLALDPRVRIVPLADLRPPGGTDQAAGADDACTEGAGPAAFAAERHHGPYSRLAERRIADYLRRCPADIVIGTRPSVNIHLARFGPRRALRIAQEHRSLDAHPERLRRELARHYRSLDALITTTEADAAAYRERMPLPGVRVLAAPDSVPEPPGAPSSGTAKVVVAAGQLARGKRFDLLIEAFSAVAAKCPDWRLRIYGGGAERDRLELLVAGLGLGRHVELMGPHAPIEAEFAKASIAAFASETESFGMTIIEAMRCGLPVVSTDCPLGPAEIIRDGVDGLLVPTGDGQALAAALLDLIGDAPRRRAMAAAALDGSRRFDPAPIARGYERLFAELDATRRRRAVRRGYAAARATFRAIARRGTRPRTPGAPTPGRAAAGAEGMGPARRTDSGHTDNSGTARGGGGDAPAPGAASPRGTALRWAAPQPGERRCAAAAPPATAPRRPARRIGVRWSSAQGRAARRAAADGATAAAQRRAAARAARQSARQSARRRGRATGATTVQPTDVRVNGPRRGATSRLRTRRRAVSPTGARWGNAARLSTRQVNVPWMSARRGNASRIGARRKGVSRAGTRWRAALPARTPRGAVPRMGTRRETAWRMGTRRVAERLFARRRAGAVRRAARRGTGPWGAGLPFGPRRGGAPAVLAVRGRASRFDVRAATVEGNGLWAGLVAWFLARPGMGGRTAADAVLADRVRPAFPRFGGQPTGGLCGRLANPRFPRPFGGPGAGACGEPG